MFTGILCIVSSILLGVVFRSESGYNDVFTGIGYVGLMLFIVGFLIFETVK